MDVATTARPLSRRAQQQRTPFAASRKSLFCAGLALLIGTLAGAPLSAQNHAVVRNNLSVVRAPLPQSRTAQGVTSSPVVLAGITLYRYTDRAGRVHLTDHPPPPGARKLLRITVLRRLPPPTQIAAALRASARWQKILSQKIKPDPGIEKNRRRGNRSVRHARHSAVAEPKKSCEFARRKIKLLEQQSRRNSNERQRRCKRLWSDVYYQSCHQRRYRPGAIERARRCRRG